MSKHVKIHPNDTTTSIPLSRVSTPSETSAFIKQEIKRNQTEFFEIETLEVTDVFLNDAGERVIIEGNFLSDGSSPGPIRPIDPYFTKVPVRGEHVRVAEYESGFFYLDIVNRKGRVNQNSIPGASRSYKTDMKFGDTFEQKKVKPIEAGEGCLLIEGRLGQTIHLDGSGNKPSLKLSTHIDETDGFFRKENIDEDNSSIYLTSDGLRGQGFVGQEIKKNSILMRSDDILINSRSRLILEADEVFIHSRKGQTIKMGDPRAVFVPTIDAMKLTELMKNIMSFVSKTFSAIGKASNPATLVQAAKDIKKAVGTDLPEIIDTVEKEKYLNKQVMVQMPDVEIPKAPKVNLSPKIPNVPNVPTTFPDKESFKR